MTWLAKYLTGFIAACILAGLCRRMLVGSKHFQSLGNMIIGIFLLFSMLCPLYSIDWKDVSLPIQGFQEDYARISEDAEIYQQEAMRQRIKAQTETYIWNKAQELALSVKLDVRLQDAYPYAPCGITITGQASPYAKNQLSQFIQEQIGISKEAQTWTAS